MRAPYLLFFIFLFQVIFAPEKSHSEMKKPAPVLVIESNSSGIVWQSIVDILWHEDKLYLLDNGLSQAHILSANGKYLGLLAGEGDGPGDLRNPTSISINNNGNVVVCSQMFGKCEEFEGDSSAFLRSFTLHSLESEAVCIVVRVEWRNGLRYEHFLLQKIEGTTVIGETRISQFEPDGTETILYKHLAERDWKEWNEKTSVPFFKEAWEIDENGSLWCANNWEKPVLTNPITFQKISLGNYLPRLRTKEEQEEIRKEVMQFAGMENVEIWPTKRAVIALKWDSGMRLLGERAGQDNASYILCGSNVPGGQLKIQSPLSEKENKVYLLENNYIAFVYDEEMEYDSAWGEKIQGPCIVVVSYEK